MTEEESEIYDLIGLLLRRGGIKIGVPILVGAVLIAIGLGELSRGLEVLALIAVTIGAVLMLYGIYELNKRREDVKKEKAPSVASNGGRANRLHLLNGHRAIEVEFPACRRFSQTGNGCHEYRAV